MVARGGALAVMVLALARIAVFDATQGLIPNAITLPAAAVVLLLDYKVGTHVLVVNLLIGLGLAAGLLVVALTSPGQVGGGTIKLVAVLGFGLGSAALWAFVVAALGGGGYTYFRYRDTRRFLDFSAWLSAAGILVAIILALT